MLGKTDESQMMIDEHILDDGSYWRAYIDELEGHLLVQDDSGLRGVLPVHSLIAVMDRYAKPLDDVVSVDSPPLRFADGVTLQGFRYRAQMDAYPRDYLVLKVPGKEPVAALSTVVASALRHLVRKQHTIRA